MDQQPPTTPPAAYPVDVSVRYPERPSRLLALLGVFFGIKGLLLIPHFIVLWLLATVAWFLSWIAFIAVVITGTYPRGLFDFGVGVQRWQLRINAWFYGWTDRYPPFSLD